MGCKYSNDVTFILQNTIYIVKSRALSSRSLLQASLLISSFYYELVELVLDVVSNFA